MYNLLVVDDEEIAIRGIVHGIDWSEMPLANLFSAYDGEEAKRIFQEHPVHVMISDIDMPGENGIELLSWVNEHSPQTETIFLTGHADFKFAQQAVHLNSFDYLLKPIDHDKLKECVERALDSVREREQDASFRKTYEFYYEQWNRQLPLLVERFWQDVLGQRIVLTAEKLGPLFALYGIGLDMSTPVLPVLISVEEWKREWSERDEEIMSYALKNAAGEILLHGREGHAVQVQNGMLLALLYAPAGGEERELEERCREYIEGCGQYLYCRISCYIGEPVTTGGLPACTERLSEMERSNIGRTGTVLRLDSFEKPAGLTEAVPRFADWAALMEQGNKQELLQRIEELFGRLQAGQVNQAYMAQYYFGLVGAVFQLLQKQGVSPSDVYPEDEWQDGGQAMKSVGAMKTWTIRFTLKAAEFFSGQEKSVSSAIAKVKRFIETNLHLDLNREEIAAHVYLNPAYLSRLFRKETGKSLTDYTVELRMEKAKKELEKTNIKISDVAGSVGYSNFSHFSKLFKKTTGLTPQEYRKKYQDIAQ